MKFNKDFNKKQGNLIFYIILILIFEIAKEELIINEELVIISSFIFSLILIYNLVNKSIEELLKNRLNEILIIFINLSIVNIKLLNNLKNIINYFKIMQKIIKRKLLLDLRKSQFWCNLMKINLKLQIIRLCEKILITLLLKCIVGYERKNDF